MDADHAHHTVITVITAIALAVVVMAPAAADTPQHAVLDFTGEYVDDSLCDFPVTVAYEGGANLRRFFDRDGTVYKVLITPSGPLTETWSANGRAIEINYRPNLQFTFDDGEIVLTRLGLFASVPIPGMGQLWVEAGRFSMYRDLGEIISVAGVWPTLALTDPSGLAPVCDYLS